MIEEPAAPAPAAVEEPAAPAPAAIEEPAAPAPEMIEEPAAPAAQARPHKKAVAENEIIAYQSTTNQAELIEIEDEIQAAEEEPFAASIVTEAEEIIAEEIAPLAAANVTAPIAVAVSEEVAETETEAPTFVAVASMQVADFVEMEEAEVPMAAAGTWSLATMIFAGMSLLLAVFTIASKGISRRMKFAAAVLVAATAAIVLATSDLNGMMVTADKGTLAVVILNIFEVVFASTASNEARLG